MSSGRRRLRAFKRWMASQGIECSDAVHLTEIPHYQGGGGGGGFAVKALCSLRNGDLVARIPKLSCLTIRTSAASQLIQHASLDGSLALALAIMYERSLRHLSSWASYLHLLPHHESLPLVWSMDEVDSLLCGTELHKTVKEDKALIVEDWKESILPLLDSAPFKLDPSFFSVEEYFAARTLIASRSFEIDSYHGFGMVPLADLFNHKTGAEDVHFTSVSSQSELVDEAQSGPDNEAHCSKTIESDSAVNDEPTTLIPPVDNTGSDTDVIGRNSCSDDEPECHSVLDEGSAALEMIMVKDVEAGNEVFNTYGSSGNAALLHRYGFTEPDNPFDIVNIDLELVLQWSSSLFSSRYSRARLSLFRRLDYSACVSENSEYFEISSDGEPQIELLILLYIMLLPEDAYCKLDITVSTAGNVNGSMGMLLLDKSDILCKETSKMTQMNKDLLLTKDVCKALLSLADIREGLYGPNSIKDDAEALARCCRVRERKLYHSLVLRVSERRILEKLRTYATLGARLRNAKGCSMRKKLKRT
ncbi:ribosomal lysine N-methyltransferase 3 isoform X1 [Ziziphus jujuba]|uniref:N-lysine methyltransferase n=1 Tax=Ziziphus jujuba TaxID=326968 RepID=A0A6P3YS66_ZIZJJ|nr:ribosomal lysine N-methyltransferase 3 isoform X1 [Ziziphus jujuba]